MTIYRRPDPVPIKRGKTADSLGEEPLRNSKDLYELAAFRIFRSIEAGETREGDILPSEEVLVEQLGVSRTVVREAIKFLTAKGIVQARRRRGTIVLNREGWSLIDPDTIGWLDDAGYTFGLLDDLWGVLRATQPGLASISAQSGVDLTELAKRVGDSSAKDPNLVRLICEFHVAVAAASDNQFLLSMTKRSADAFFSLSHGGLPKTISGLDRARYAKVAEQIVNRCPKGAERAMRQIFFLGTSNAARESGEAVR